MKRLRIAIAGLTACSGCQLSLLNCEAELPQLLELVDVSFFPLACSPAVLEGEYDAALVEGCLSMPHERELLLTLRQQSTFLIALGTCAAHGGVAALKNGEDRPVLLRQVHGDLLGDMTADVPQPLHSIVRVDASLHGCPPEKKELLDLLAGLLRGVLPVPVDYPVCNDCRMRENLCLLTERGELCLGLLTRGGCEARCPSMGVTCEGCRGPASEPNLNEALAVYRQQGFDSAMVRGRLNRFCPEWMT